MVKKNDELVSDENFKEITADEGVSADSTDLELSESAEGEGNAKTENVEKTTLKVSTPFYKKAETTIKDVLSFHNYKRLSLAPAILLGIVLSPFLITFLLLSAAFYIMLFSYKMLVAPADYLISSMKSDHENLWIQLVIYIFGYPVVLIFRIAGAMLGIGFFFVNFLINCFGFVYSIGGMHFHAFLYDDQPADKPFCKAPYSKAQNIIALVVAIVILLALILSIVIPSVGSSSYDPDYNAPENSDNYATNTSRSTADTMSYFNDSRRYTVRDGDSIWIRLNVPSGTEVTVDVSCSSSLGLDVYLYMNNHNSYELNKYDSSNVTLDIPSTYIDATYYVKISCTFHSYWGEISVSTY